VSSVYKISDEGDKFVISRRKGTVKVYIDYTMHNVDRATAVANICCDALNKEAGSFEPDTTVEPPPFDIVSEGGI
jgi:hypothetical protein